MSAEAEKRESGAMRAVAGWAAVFEIGDFYFEEHAGRTHLCVLLPGNAIFGRHNGAAFARLPVTPGDPHGWQWDGNRDAPTLSPSVHCHGEWHGFIRAGRYESC